MSASSSRSGTTSVRTCSRHGPALPIIPLVGEARMVGLIGALELVREKTTRAAFTEPGKVGTLRRDLCIEQRPRDVRGTRHA